MKTSYPKTLFLLLFIFLINATNSQEVISDTNTLESSKKTFPGLKKNAIYITGGTLGSTYGFFNGNYERMIWGNKNPIFRSVFIRLSIGKFKGESLSGFIAYSTYKATTYMATLGGLLGRRSSFFEFNAGCTFFSGTETKTSAWTGEVRTLSYTETLPALNLGYRYQEPGGHFIFRMGVGFYELYYISLGFCL